MGLKDTGSLHLKVQEMIDCYKETDPLLEMAAVEKESDAAEAAIKWLAVSILHGINANAKKITLERSEKDGIRATVKYHKQELPSPGAEIGARVIEDIREITHIEGKKGKIPLALGIGDSSVEVGVKVKAEDGEEKVTLKFPKSRD